MSDDLNLDVYFPQFAKFLLASNNCTAFSKLSTIGTWQRDAEHALEASLCRQFEVQKQADWPLAPLMLLGESHTQATGYWLLVHPVNFVLQRDFFSLGESLHLSSSEAASLLADFNHHFAEDGLRFVPSQSGQWWYLHIEAHVEVSTYLLAESLGRDVGKHLPNGKQGMQFQALLNEVQMLLHDHAVNAAREQQGLPVMNSLWLSGGGSFQAMHHAAKPPAFNLFANDMLSAGLASFTGITPQDLPSHYQSFCDKKSQGDAVVVLNEVQTHADEKLEADWFAPLLQALKRKEIDTLRCHFDVHGMTFTLTVKSTDTWRFWRWKFWQKAASVTSYFQLADA